MEEEGEEISSDKGSVESDQKLGLEDYESDTEAAREQSPKVNNINMCLIDSVVISLLVL